VKRLKWPGEAAVIVSVVHVCKGDVVGPYWLSGRAVDRITAFLFHAGGHEDAATLAENEGKSFVGSYVLGMGFTFDDMGKEGVASSLADMQQLIEKNPRNAERIFPYLGGEEVNDSPTHTNRRFVINFAQLTEASARMYPDLIEIVERKVKPERILLGDNPDALHRKEFWWQWGRYTPALFDAIRGLGRVLVVSRHGDALAFAFVPAASVYAESIVVFAYQTYNAFSILQSRVHDSWARFCGSSIKDDLRYSPSDCFETFPFATKHETNSGLEAAGKTYYEFRADLMVRHNEGLTKTYNRFHRPDEYSPDILKLRELHDAMDRAVLDAYGWHDLRPTCEFFPEFDDEDDEETESARPRQKRYRYRWPDDIHDEVLARLLALNRGRAGMPAEPVAAPPRTPRKSARQKKAVPPDQSKLF
jgi:hypothetical protein